LNAKPFLRALAVSVISLAVAAPFAACGQSVASCADVCPAATSATGCALACTDLQTKCSASNDPGDFQDLITCIANASGSLSPLPTLCEPQQAAVTANCTGVAPVDGG